MNVFEADNGISVRDAEGVVWHEKFTAEDCLNIWEVMERVYDTHVPSPVRPVFKRLMDAMLALQNDSDACLITSSTDDRPVNVYDVEKRGYVVVGGNLINGFFAEGVFPTQAMANAYAAERNGKHDQAEVRWVLELCAPLPDEDD